MEDDGFLADEDRQLREREFVIADPELAPNLVATIPPLKGPPNIIAKYDLKNTGRPKLRCGHCGTRHHWKGYLLELEDGRHALLAERHCGRKAFGLRWQEVENVFLDAESRQTDLARLIKVRKAWSEFHRQLRVLVSRPEFGVVGVYLDELRHRFGKLSQALARCAREDGVLFITVEVRDQEAEDRRARLEAPDLFKAIDEALDKDTDSIRRAQSNLRKWMETRGQITKPKREPKGTCAGYKILSAKLPEKLLADAIKHADHWAPLIMGRRSSEWKKPADFKETFHAFRVCTHSHYPLYCWPSRGGLESGYHHEAAARHLPCFRARETHCRGRDHIPKAEHLAEREKLKGRALIANLSTDFDVGRSARKSVGLWVSLENFDQFSSVFLGGGLIDADYKKFEVNFLDARRRFGDVRHGVNSHDATRFFVQIAAFLDRVHQMLVAVNHLAFAKLNGRLGKDFVEPIKVHVTP